MMGHLERTGLIDLFPRTGNESTAYLTSRIRNARQRITMFGLTRNYYAREDMLALFETKAADIPVRIYIMDPHCASRQDRYRLEPAEAAMEEIDDVIRVMLYGHGKRGTEGPILTFASGTDYHDYFASQLRWLDRLANDHTREPWASKEIHVRPYRPQK